jgi:hypothetical protein
LDTTRVSTGELIAGLGGAVLFVSLFLKWFGDFSAWELFDVTDVWLALIALVVVGLLVARATGSGPALPASPGRLMVILGGMALVIVLVNLFEGDERKFGLWLSFFSTLAIVYGGVATGDAPVTRTRPTPPPPPV